MDGGGQRHQSDRRRRGDAALAMCAPGCTCLRHRRGLHASAAKTRPVLERLAERSYTDLRTGCTVWHGGKANTWGNGTISIGGTKWLVHRAAWTEENGPIPDGLDCLHHCDNPPCWNVCHLFLGTHVDNMADRDRKGRQFTPLGEAHGKSVLTAQQVLAIRRDARPARLVAPDFGISESNVYMIRGGHTWRHL